jgi:hypothetical protein
MSLMSGFGGRSLTGCTGQDSAKFPIDWEFELNPGGVTPGLPDMSVSTAFQLTEMVNNDKLLLSDHRLMAGPQQGGVDDMSQGGENDLLTLGVE